ncbi:MAG: DNA gyrase C-terminal beta-propeller domain-containing protein [Gammaproteobacteria bacterium]
MVNLLPLEPDERINAVLPVQLFASNYSSWPPVTTKTALDSFSRPRTAGIRAIELHDGDRHGRRRHYRTDGERDIMPCELGQGDPVQESDVRAMGRTAAGVRHSPARRPRSDRPADYRRGEILTATEKGYGKRTEVSEFPVQGRGGQGVIAIQTSDRNGRMVGATQVLDEDEVVLISASGTLVPNMAERLPARPQYEGVRLIRIDEEDRLVGLDIAPRPATAKSGCSGHSRRIRRI